MDMPYIAGRIQNMIDAAGNKDSEPVLAEIESLVAEIESKVAQMEKAEPPAGQSFGYPADLRGRPVASRDRRSPARSGS